MLFLRFSAIPRLFCMIVLFALKGLPLSVRRNLFAFFALGIYFLWPKGRSRMKKNAKLLRPDLSGGEIAAGIKRNLRTIAYSWAALLCNDPIFSEDSARRLLVDGIEPILENAGKEKLVFAAAHVGPVDALLEAVAAYGLRIYMPVEPVRPEWLGRFMLDMRGKFKGLTVEPIEKGKTLSRASSRLAAGEAVLVAVDILRGWDAERRAICRVGNARVAFPVGAVGLAMMNNARLIPVLSGQDKFGRLKIRFLEPFSLLRTGNFRDDAKENTKRLINEIYAPHLQANWDSWTQLPWSDLSAA
ncbi:MAG: hypothetical protein UY15_C0004G0011 [Parcubacteria group bacterium GW2011_GWA2_47_9]|nr:MAG: hypothetical protein UY15_C0004G0011 [Parcubacteria group bacterium GW2011_GWA2_47_9]